MSTWTKDELSEINDKITEVLDIPMEVEDYEGNTVPSVEDLDDSNEGLLVECAILFVDIRGSTTLSDTSWAKSMAKIYRAFVRAMVMCVHKSGGSVRQIVGDRVMGVFVNEEGIKATEKALEAARAIVTTVDYYFNPECRKKVNGKEIQCGVGIDYGKVLLTQVGMKAQDEEAKDLVWAGKIANMASKHTDLAAASEIFITKRFYDNLPSNKKSDDIAWESVVRLKGNSLFEGFVKEDFYLDCMNEEETTVESTLAKLSTDGGKEDLNAIDLINKIVQGTQQQTELLLQKFETIVRREVALEEGERILKAKQLEITLKEQALSEQRQSLDKMKADVLKETEFKKNEVEFSVKAEFLSNNINSFKFEKTLEEMQSIFVLGEKIGKTDLDVKKSKLYYWRLVPYTKKFDLYFAYRLIEEYFKNFPINSISMPFERDLIDVVKRTNKANEFFELIKWNMKQYSSDIKGLLQIKNVLDALQITHGIDLSGRKLLSENTPN